MTIYTLTSDLRDEKSVEAVTKEFLSSLDINYELRNDFTDYGSHALDVIFIRTGGTEGIFKKLLPELQKNSKKPFYMLASGKGNSLAAAMEILSFMRQQGIVGEIIHGDAEYIAYRLRLLEQVAKAKQTLATYHFGVIGQPSDWLISSGVDYEEVKRQTGITITDIPMQELMEALPANKSIYAALRTLIERYGLQGFTLRCFELISAIQDTGCLALAHLNSEGLVAGCEGDIPSMITMAIVRSLLGISGFMANPNTINPETGETLFAHCTIPLDMVERYELDTHYESGIGTGVRGFMKEGPVTIFKVSGDLKRHFIAEGRLKMNLALPNMCRTQQVIQLNDRSQAAYFLNDPIGNHHIIVPGHRKELFEEILR
jgi:L-fucose isomerase-like protein